MSGVRKLLTLMSIIVLSGLVPSVFGKPEEKNPLDEAKKVAKMAMKFHQTVGGGNSKNIFVIILKIPSFFSSY